MLPSYLFLPDFLPCFYFLSSSLKASVELHKKKEKKQTKQKNSMYKLSFSLTKPKLKEEKYFVFLF